MKEIWVWIQAALAAVGGALGWFLGGWDGFLYALVAFVVLDYLTGVLCAVADKKLSSEIGFKGISRKVLIFALVGVGNIIDSQVLGDGGHLFLSVQRGCVHSGKRGASGASHPRKTEGGSGTAA